MYQNIKVLDPVTILEALPVPIVVLDEDLRLSAMNLLAKKLWDLESSPSVDISLAQLFPQGFSLIEKSVASCHTTSDLVVPDLPDSLLHIAVNSDSCGGYILTIFGPSFRNHLEYLPPPVDPMAHYFRRILEASSDGISVVDTNGTVIFANQASSNNLGISIDEQLGKSAENLVSSGIQDKCVSSEVLQNKNQTSKIIKALKTKKSILTTGTPILDENGEITLVIINERDLTELSEIRSRLNREQELNKKFREELNVLALVELEKQEFLVSNPQMMELIRIAYKLANLGVQRLLIEGESGTGKGLLAKFYHKISPRSEEPFISVNCAALPDQLLEAELFGYERGAFTGADPKGKPGLFELAGTGTIFLDEIGEIPMSLQAKLLTFMDEQTFMRLGGTKVVKSNCAVVAATNKDLGSLVNSKQFRQDLYYRLSHFTLTLMPLRQRPEDITLLARHELEKLNKEYSLSRRLSASALRSLCRHSFPGNVRELLSILRQAVILSDDDDLGIYLESTLGRSQEMRPQSGTKISINETLDVRQSLIEALNTCRNTREMAKYLGWSQPTVSRRLRKHGLKAPGSCSR